MRPGTVAKVLSHVLLLATLAVPIALAQQKAAPSGMPKYDRATEVTLKGTIDEVQEFPEGKGEVHLQLLVKTGQGVSTVHLCPPKFLQALEVNLAKGDQVEIIGSKVTMDGKDVIMAREIIKGTSTLVLRDKQGAPVWTWMKN